ncbi:MAG: response regulator [Zetaproteobacteria bacterium]|nr:response regulator [Zetaproteobacteria bacterium]
MTYSPCVILVAEDCEVDFRLLQQALQEAMKSFERPVALHRCTMGDEVLPYLDRSQPPGAILLDLDLPRISGYVLLQKIIAHSEYRNIPAYILSSLPQHPFVNGLIQQGAAGILDKRSFAQVSLKAMLSSVMGMCDGGYCGKVSSHIGKDGE